MLHVKHKEQFLLHRCQNRQLKLLITNAIMHYGLSSTMRTVSVSRVLARSWRLQFDGGSELTVDPRMFYCDNCACKCKSQSLFSHAFSPRLAPVYCPVTYALFKSYALQFQLSSACLCPRPAQSFYCSSVLFTSNFIVVRLRPIFYLYYVPQWCC